jgi:hypothetical protein
MGLSGPDVDRRHAHCELKMDFRVHRRSCGEMSTDWPSAMIISSNPPGGPLWLNLTSAKRFQLLGLRRPKQREGRRGSGSSVQPTRFRSAPK